MSSSENDVVVHIEVRVPMTGSRDIVTRIKGGPGFPPLYGCNIGQGDSILLAPGNILSVIANGADLCSAVCGGVYSQNYTAMNVPASPITPYVCGPNPHGYSQVPLPNITVNNCSGSPGAQNTLVLWFQTGPSKYDPFPIPFFAVCAGSGSGSGTSVLRELMCKPDLHITIPSGANRGGYRAMAVALMRWNVTIRGINYVLVGGDAGANLAIQGPHGSMASTSVAFDPYVAMIPGEFFGATHDVVVTLA